jgi:hypothetical protein
LDQLVVVKKYSREISNQTKLYCMHSSHPLIPAVCACFISTQYPHLCVVMNIHCTARPQNNPKRCPFTLAHKYTGNREGTTATTTSKRYDNNHKIHKLIARRHSSSGSSSTQWSCQHCHGVFMANY